MQARSTAYQAVISLTREAHENGNGVPYSSLVKQVALFVDEEAGYAQRIRRLKTDPNETYAETATKGTRDIARKLIDAAKRQGLILYGTPETHSGNSVGRFVYWRRPARNGGRYGVPEVAEEDRAHDLFMRRHSA